MGLTLIQRSAGKPRRRNPKVALVLAGGAVAGGAFKVGGLKALDECLGSRGINDFDMYVGLSAGAFLATSLAQGITPSEMIAALDRGQLAAAALDVFDPEPLPTDNPLWDHPKVRVTAHTSFGGDGTRLRWDQLFFDNLPRYVRGETLLHEVNPADIV